MTAAVRSVDDRIAELFVAGHGIDFVSERGVPGGWTRADALRVASDRGWVLDSSGRIPPESRRGGPPPTAAARPLASVSQPGPVSKAPAELGPVELLTRGKRHRVAAVRRAADRVEVAVEALRKLLIDQVDADRAAAAREREVEEARRKLADVEAEAARLKAVIRGKPAARAVAPGKSRGGNPTGACARCGAPNGGRGVPGHRESCKP